MRSSPSSPLLPLRHHHPPIMLAQNPTAKSLPPLRAMAPKRCGSVKVGMPGCTIWKALSGQVAKKARTSLLLGAGALHAGEMCVCVRESMRVKKRDEVFCAQLLPAFPPPSPSTAHVKASVGAGSQVKQKSARMAISTFVRTKSSSLKKSSPRRVRSAALHVGIGGWQRGSIEEDRQAF